MGTLEQKIKTIIANAIEIDISELGEESGIYRVRNWDSLGHLTVVVALENQFGISIPDEELEHLTTVSTIVNYFERRLRRVHQHEDSGT